jgi:hypothetical protein
MIMIPMQLVVTPETERESGAYETLGIDSIEESVIPDEDLTIVISMSDQYDINEKIYVGVAGIRTAKAVYVKPISLKFELISKEFTGVDFIIATHEGYYEDSTWIKDAAAPVDRYNDYIYYSTFEPFNFDAQLTMRITMEWLTPWHEVLESVETKDFSVGHWYNVTSVVRETRDNIEDTILSGIDLGVNLAEGLITSVNNDLSMFQSVATSLQSMIVSAGADPASLNLFVVDLVGNSTTPGPMYYLARDDLYSTTGSVATRDTKMDARHSFIMQNIKDSLTVLDRKIGNDTDASDGIYNYTITFVRELYEEVDGTVPDDLYVNPADSCDTQFYHGDRHGNVTGGSWTDDREASLEFLLESMTGSHPDFKSSLGSAKNTRPVRKSIVLNTMGPYFPVMNSWYDYFKLGPDNESDPTTNLNRVVLKYDNTKTDGGSSNWSGNANDMFNKFNASLPNQYYYGFPKVHFGRYIKKLGTGMADSYYFWINLGGGKPFSKLTRDINYDVGGGLNHFFSDGEHDVIIELENSGYNTYYRISNTIINSGNPNFIVSYFGARSSFQIIDAYAQITNDRLSLLVDSTQIGSTHTEYYKINAGRWVDAFFNGTDLSNLHGTLQDPTYITAADNASQPWFSSKAMHYSFGYEDVASFQQLGLLRDYRAPNEYVWVPFVGPNKNVPVGWMTSSRSWYSVIGTDDYQMALEYLYGGIFMGYKQTVLHYKNVGIMSVIAALEGTNVPESRLENIVNKIDELDTAWMELNLARIDEIGTEILEAVNEKNGQNLTMIDEAVRRSKFRSSIAIAVLNEDSDQYSYVDEGLDTAGSDLTFGSVGESLTTMLVNNVQPALDQIGKLIGNTLDFIAQTKSNVLNATHDLEDEAFDWMENSFTSMMRYSLGIADWAGEAFDNTVDMVVDIAGGVNDTINSLTNGVIQFTNNSLNALKGGITNAFTEIGKFLNESVFDTISDIIIQIEDGVIEVTDGFYEISRNVLGAINDTTGNILGWFSKFINDTEATINAISDGVVTAVDRLERSPVSWIDNIVDSSFLGSALRAIDADPNFTFTLLGDFLDGQLTVDNITEEGAALITGFASTVLGTVNNWTTEGADLLIGGAANFASGVYNTTSTAITSAFGTAGGLVTGARDNTNGLLTALNTAMDVGINQSIDFVNYIGDVSTGVVSDITAFVGDSADTMQDFGSNIKSGIQFAVTEALQIGNQVIDWTHGQVTEIVTNNIELVNTIIVTTKASIDNTLSLVIFVTQVIQEVNNVLLKLVEKIGEAFKQVTEIFNEVTDALIDIAGAPVEFAVDLAGSIAGQLQAAEEQLERSTGFYTVVDTVYEEIKSARTAASILEYTEQTMGQSSDLFFKWVDVFQPLSNAKGGDTGFKIFQMGTAFSDRLFIIIIYNGTPVVADDVDVKVSRPVTFNETSLTTDRFLEAAIPAFQVYENATLVPGLYYCSFNTTVEHDWYDGDGFIKTERAIPAEYLVRTDANYTTPLESPHEGTTLNNSWMEKTELFDPQFTIDAFPIVTVLTEYTAAITAGTTVPLLIGIENEMYSEPSVRASISISTDTGFVIASRTIGNIQLGSEEDGVQTYSFEWAPLESSPGGEFDLIITITEANGDTTSVITPVEIVATTILGDIIGWIIGLFSSLFGGLGIGAFASEKRRRGKGTKVPEKVKKLKLKGKTTIPMPKDCTDKMVELGLCLLDGVKLDCDTRTKECKIN